MRRWSLAIGVSVGALSCLVSHSASAGPIEVCVNAANEAEQLRKDEQRPTKTLEKYRACAVDECPELLRNECRRSLNEITAIVPSIVLVAEGEEGESVFDVHVTLDGTPLVKGLDGKPIPIDPGLHTFVFNRDGVAPVEVRTVIRAGQKSAEVRGRFPRRTAPPPAARAEPGQTVSVPVAPEAPHTTSSSLSTIGLATAGTGVVGIALGAFFGLTASSEKADARCPDNVCDPSAGGNADKLRDAKTSGNVSTLFFVAGGVVAAGGLTLYLLAPRSQSGTSARLQPALGTSSAGLVIDGILF